MSSIVNEVHLDRDKCCINQVLSRYFPIVATYGKGSYLVDNAGYRYLDWTSGIGVTNVGHNHPKVVKAIKDQAEKLLHTSVVTYNMPYIDLAEQLIPRLPGNGHLNSIFFANSGAEVVDGAIKMARYTTGRPAIINFQGSFHGRTLLATALTTSKSHYRHGLDPLPSAIYTVPFPDARFYDNTLQSIQDLFDHVVQPDQVAAFIIEPVLGEGGYLEAIEDFFIELRQIADHHGILIIADEIQSGFGRTGKMFAMDHYDTIPDILLMAKGIASGMPLSAFAANRELTSKWPTASHGSTFGGNPVSCAAALATLEVFDKEDILTKSATLGQYLSSDLMQFLNTYFPEPGDFQLTGIGPMIGLHSNPQWTEQIIAECFKQKLLLLPCGTYGEAIRLIPALNMDHRDTDKGLAILKNSIGKVASNI